jgi:uncharacterized protein (DUF1697 family)
MNSAPADTALGGLNRLLQLSEKVAMAGDCIYLSCPDGYGKSKLSNTAIEKKLSVTATTRNCNTVTRLLEMAGE